MIREPEWTDNALRVLEARYLRRDRGGRVAESPRELIRRVAHAVAEAGQRCDGEWLGEEYENLLASLDFLPNSPTLMNAGTERGQLSACFVLPLGDSMEEIFETLKRTALIQQTGGGTGFSFSSLRPRGTPVRKTGGEASGPVSFLRIFDQATEHIRQGGRRRGANMGVLRVDHPDILEFVRLKGRGEPLRNFNLSVGVTDDFMVAVEGGGTIELRHPASSDRRSMCAAELFEDIVQASWQCGDPGLLFLDTINRANPTPQLGVLEATNPCGEVPLLPYEACNLGSLNLARMVTQREGQTDIDWDKLARVVRLAVRFLDDVIEANHYPYVEIEEVVRGNRKIGLGVMGFAEMLIQLGVPYDSDEAEQWAGRLMESIAREAHAASRGLAVERGSFPNWTAEDPRLRGEERRNATCTAVAPTGTIGLIAGTSGGIEPLFALAHRRHHEMGGEPLFELNRFVREALHDLPAGRGILERVRKTGTLSGVPGVPTSLRTLFRTASEIPPRRHLRIQAAFQQHVDNSVSKTINLPEEASPKEVREIFLQAWKLGLKGITVFRQGSPTGSVLRAGQSV